MLDIDIEILSVNDDTRYKHRGEKSYTPVDVNGHATDGAASDGRKALAAIVVTHIVVGGGQLVPVNRLPVLGVHMGRLVVRQP